MESENHRVVRRRVKMRTVEKRTKKSFFYKRVKFGKQSSLYYWEAGIIAFMFLILFIGLLSLLVTVSWDKYTPPENFRPNPNRVF
jgi:hypothetical protein